MMALLGDDLVFIIEIGESPRVSLTALSLPFFSHSSNNQEQRIESGSQGLPAVHW